MRILAALAVGLVVVPTVTLAIAPQAAFAQGDQDESLVDGTGVSSGSATSEPEVQVSGAPSPAATSTETVPAEPPSPSGAEPSSPATHDADSGPTIASDLADYPPGGTVTLTGMSWQEREVVTIVVNDTGGLSWKLTEEVVADAGGRFTLTFKLPDHYVPDYDVTATGALSGVATTTFTDATQPYYFWMTQSSPSATTSVTGGTPITYNLHGRRNGNFDVTNAVITLTLTGSATFDTAVPAGFTRSADGKSASWRPGSLGTSTTTVAVTATVASGAQAGLVVATVSGDTNGTFFGGDTTRFVSLTHSVTGNCSFATGSGDFSRSICWFDLAGYNPTTAATINGQNMQQRLLNGYVLSYTITAGTNTNVVAYAPPTYSAAFLGNTGAGYTNNYQGMKGKPALYQQSAGTTVLTLKNISLKDSAGTVVTGFALVGADAESTDSNESITWKSDKALTSIGPLGNSCGGTLVMSSGNTQAVCNAGPVANKTGAAILYTLDPTVFTQTMVGSGLQAVAFGVMVSGLQLNKQIVNKLPGDQFRISVKRSDTTEAGSALTDLTTGYAATDQIYTISSGSSQTFTMSEEPVGNTNPVNYLVTWACTRNGVAFTPTDISPGIKAASVTMSDFVTCTITNTAAALTLTKSVDNTAGGALTPANWTLTATKSGSAPAIAEAPLRSSTTTGKVTTASTATVAVPAGAYALGESSTATGADRYAGTSWSCTRAGSGASTPNAVLAAGDNVTCTITNTYVAGVIVTKTWTNGVNGDKAELVINSATSSPGKVTSTSNGSSGSWTDAANVARATPAVGSTVSVAEVMDLANRGTYTRAVTCLEGANPITVVNGAFTMPRGDVSCAYTNTVVAGTATFSKVDAGSTSTLLGGSEWTLTGPSVPTPGTTIVDCASAPCAGPDTDPVVGQFSLPLLAGTYSLVEKKAPFGFQLDPTVRSFAIVTDGLVVSLGALGNQRSAVPALPLTGGASTDAFLLAGAALIASAGIAARRHRRRLLSSK